MVFINKIKKFSENDEILEKVTVYYSILLKFGGCSMLFKLAVHTSTKVIYLICSENEIDSIFDMYKDSQIFILNILNS